jgi:hypothetical protein
MKANAKREFADFLQKRLSEGGLTYVEVAAAALLARVRGWNRAAKKSKPKTRRKTQPQHHVGDAIEQKGEKFTVAEVRFGKIIAVKDAAGAIHRQEEQS